MSEYARGQLVAHLKAAEASLRSACALAGELELNDVVAKLRPMIDGLFAVDVSRRRV